MPSEIERFEPRARAAGAVLMEWVHEGRFIYHSDHLAQLAAKDEEIERLKGKLDEQRGREPGIAGPRDYEFAERIFAGWHERADKAEQARPRSYWRATVAEIAKWHIRHSGVGIGGAVEGPATNGDALVVRHSDHQAQLAAKDEEIERAREERDANFIDACANLDLLELNRQAVKSRDEEIERVRKHEQETAEAAVHRVEAEQALFVAELEKLAEEFDERHDRKRKLARICAAANRPESSILVNIAAEDAFIAHRLRERAAELREGAA